MILKKLTAILFIIVFILSTTYILGIEKEDKFLLLKIGDKRFKDKIIEVCSGKIYSTREGRSVTFSKMIKEMKESRFVYVGESHNSLPMHDIQFEIIQTLYNQDKNLLVGIEMLPLDCQEVLNKWSLGILSKEEFVRKIKWYINWNFNFGYYQKIFQFVKSKKIPVYALNVPRAIISKIRMRGWETLSDEEKKLVPQPNLTNKEHRTLIRTIFESTKIPPQMKGRGLDIAFEGLYRAQSAWDEVMAFNALQAMESKEEKMVVLAGSGHFLYNLGINRRAFEKNRLAFKTVIIIPVPEGRQSVRVSRNLADYVWGIPEEERPAFPSIGLSFKKFNGLENLVIGRKLINGVAEGADFEKGDIILSVDGQAFYDINELRIYLAEFTWNEKVKFNLLRNAQEIEVTLKFRVPEKSNE